MAKPGVFIGCLPGDTREPELLDVLKSFAKVTSIKLARGRNQTAGDFCLGYGFAICQSRRDVKILLQVKEILYRGRAVILKPYKSGAVLKSEKLSLLERRIFIGKVPPYTTEETLRPHFEQFGDLEAFYFVEQSKSMKFKYGYAVYYDPVHARTAVQKLSESHALGSGVRVEFLGKSNQEHSSKKSASQTAYSDGYSEIHQEKVNQRIGNQFSPAFQTSSDRQDQESFYYRPQPRGGQDYLLASVGTPFSDETMNRRSYKNLNRFSSNHNEVANLAASLQALLSTAQTIPHFVNYRPSAKLDWQQMHYDHSPNNIRLNLARVARHPRLLP